MFCKSDPARWPWLYLLAEQKSVPVMEWRMLYYQYCEFLFNLWLALTNIICGKCLCQFPDKAFRTLGAYCSLDILSSRGERTSTHGCEDLTCTAESKCWMHLETLWVINALLKLLKHERKKSKRRIEKWARIWTDNSWICSILSPRQDIHPHL